MCRYGWVWVGTAVTAAAATTHPPSPQMTPYIKTIIDLYDRHAAERGPLTTIAKDGASIMNAAVFSIVTEFSIDRAAPIGRALFGDGSGMLLFFDLCGRCAPPAVPVPPSPPPPLTPTATGLPRNRL